MTYIYAIAPEEKQTLEKVKRYIGFAALPFAIAGGTFVKALQTSIGLVSYLYDIDSTFHLSNKLFKFKGPAVLSDVYWNNWKNFTTTDDNWNKKWHIPKINPVYDSTSIGSKHDALEKFKNLQIILNI